MSSRRSLALVATTLLAAASCARTRATPPAPPASGLAESPLQAAATALGGAAALRTISYLEITAAGTRLEPGQSSAPGRRVQDMHVSDYGYRAIDDRRGDRLRIEWTRAVKYPYPGELAYSVAIDRSGGFIDGKDGVFSGPAASMLPANVAALRKLQWLTSPDLLIATALVHADRVRAAPDERYRDRVHRVIAMTTSDSPRPLRLFIDPATGVPSKIDTVEDDPIFGDALVEVELEDWRTAAGTPALRLPFKLTHRVAGRIVQTEQRTAIRAFAAPAPAFAFVIPPEGRRTLDPDDAALGARASQWFMRMHAYGIPHYSRHAPVVLTDIAPGVVHATGGTHHSLIVEMSDHLVVVEAPLYEERTRAVIASAAKRWPNKPIRTVVSTHFHDDHTGGLRAYAAAGATIVTSAVSRDAIAAYLRAPRTVAPDALQIRPRDVPIEVAGDKLVLRDAARTIELLRVPNSHADDMLAAYLPRERLLFVSDIWSPGAGPEPFKIYNRELLAFIERTKLPVERLAGTHGGVGPLRELVTAARN